VTFVDAQRWEVADVIEGRGLAEPHGIAISADGRLLFVSNRNLKGDYPSTDKRGTVVVIDTASHTIETVIEVGSYAAGMSLGR
jgi:DNA-binding beta-propeller fold protein YncE